MASKAHLVNPSKVRAADDATIQTRIRSIVASAPPLSEEQRERLRALLSVPGGSN